MPYRLKAREGFLTGTVSMDEGQYRVIDGFLVVDTLEQARELENPAHGFALIGEETSGTAELPKSREQQIIVEDPVPVPDLSEEVPTARRENGDPRRGKSRKHGY